ncbi:uncharacterized protein DUF4157 [Rhizobium azibense]|uniref:Uncharacterized protein DUF4157 n=3 Tax=Rhizobium/Agrobacterium group TaxID=227290 RepID=A0A4R3RWV8_9HYPH|nr:uncharacterized protein DUF4157 [Rhizobium azibense]
MITLASCDIVPSCCRWPNSREPCVMMTMTIILLTGSFAVGWARLGDIGHPEQFPRDVQGEAGNAESDVSNVLGRIGWEIADIGKELDRVRSEAQVLTAAAALEQWIIVSRNTARSSAVMPMPAAIRRALGNFYDEQIYDMVTYKIGASAPLNIADLAIRYSNADAVTLIDTIIFRDEAGANDPGLWVHELTHVQQFRDWGTRSFSIRYLRDWKSVEDEAYAATDRFDTMKKRTKPRTRSPASRRPLYLKP